MIGKELFKRSSYGAAGSWKKWRHPLVNLPASNPYAEIPLFKASLPPREALMPRLEEVLWFAFHRHQLGDDGFGVDGAWQLDLLSLF